jgi:glucosyl-dolichyl phosphate glucuronosyltransferase
MKISIIIPTYNRAQILEMCFEYLVKLDYPASDFEIIVVDNNSPDNTKAVVEKYQKLYPALNIRYAFEKQQGIVYARHTGARHANYDILSYIDDDGFLNKQWLKEMARVFEQNKDVAAVASKIVIKWDQEPPEWIHPYEWLLGKLDYGDEIFYKHGIYINGGSFNIKKEILFDLHGFDLGQKDQYLVGNSEDGLNERLWNAGCLIGYTPHAVMEHYQFVNKNAREPDIIRRYTNHGIRIPYHIYAVEKRGYQGLIYNMMKRVKGIVQKRLKLMSLTASKNKDEVRHIKFLIANDWAQIPYSLRIIFNRKFRRLLKKRETFLLEKPH